MESEYRIELSGHISLVGTFGGSDREAAIAIAKMELKREGEIEEIQVDSCIFLDPDPDQVD